MKLLAMLGICSVLGLGATVAINCINKQNVKASEIVDDSDDDEDEGEDSRGLTDYFNRIKLKDCDMRDILFSHYEDSNDKLRIFEEFCIGKTRTDAFLITENEIIGIEFKSDKDTLDRLVESIDQFYEQ